MSALQPNDFEAFFEELHNRKPFPWQSRLARLACQQNWPKVIDLPTASGKTACIDIALFALAVCGNNAPRRIFFIVDRRVIVSEAVERAHSIKCKLESAQVGVLARVAQQLRRLGGDEDPLYISELRGGAFRDETWVQTPSQPTVVASTVDQAGSRLLFRGYGVGEHTWPIHAGLIANDAILFLDEAHCSKAFAGTLEAIEGYRSQTSASAVARPFCFIEITATPTRPNLQGHERFTIEASDRVDEILQRRILASKPTRLAEPVKCRKDEIGKFALALVEQATALADEANAKKIAIMVNRIVTAREVYKQLSKAQQKVMLVIGRMRQIDRDFMANEWRPLKAGMPRDADAGRRFVVSTQCLEVGADLDFDILVTECASMDALQQRFGRLDRLGDFKNARGAIVAAQWQLSGKEPDPVYGESLRNTWGFLHSITENRLVNMGIESGGGATTVAEQLKDLPADKRAGLMLQTEEAPVLLPAHLDALVQTSPGPEPEPFIEYFLHGSKRGAPDVYVVWRSDLEGSEADWIKIVAQCPPSSSEAMPVPLCAFRRWMTSESYKDESDLEIAATDEATEADYGSDAVLVWQGQENSWKARRASQIPAGATLVLPSSSLGWNDLGYKPDDCAIDRGDEAHRPMQKRICLRLHPNLIDQWDAFPNRDRLKGLVSNSASDLDKIWEELKLSNAPEFKAFSGLDSDSLSPYAAGRGWIIETYLVDNRPSKGRSVLLEDHLQHVEEAVDVIVRDLLPSDLEHALKTAARYHDYGKADLRFQAWLRNGDAIAASYARKPIAKSEKRVLRSQQECGLPKNFRHELISVLFAEKASDIDAETRDLVLHLIASHHGRCRPFAPPTIDQEAECIEFKGTSICRSELVENPACALGHGVPERFWKLTKQYGWWGLAYLEAMLRLRDRSRCQARNSA